MSAPVVRCAAKSKSSGKRCKNRAIEGATVCRLHGANKKVRAKAAVRAELHHWGLDDELVDPGETLLRLLSQSVRRAERYAAELEAMVAESPSLKEALVGDAWGEHGKTGEYIRGLAQLEAQERDRAANFATKAIAAGIAERQVRIAEQQGALIAGASKAILGRLNLSPEQQAVAGTVVGEELLELSV